jgi:hypothetical protein
LPDGITAIHFSVKVTAISGGRAETAFGQNMSKPCGTRFVKLSLLENIRNDISVTCQVSGAPSVRLTVQANPSSKVLEIGERAELLQAGDFFQSRKLK